jgi:hypothetical protein
MAKKKNDQAKGLIRVLQIVNYKEGNILIRKLPSNIYEWIVSFKGQFYSSYIIIDPVKGQTDLNEAEISEITKMLYAGAATTIDYQLGEKLSKKDEDMVKIFESGRKTLGAEA